MRGVKFAIPALFGALFFLYGCGVGPDKSREDAVDTVDVDKTPAHVIAFNNHVPNIATKCDGFGHRVYVASRLDPTASVIPVVIDDPSCR